MKYKYNRKHELQSPSIKVKCSVHEFWNVCRSLYDPDDGEKDPWNVGNFNHLMWLFTPKDFINKELRKDVGSKWDIPWEINNLFEKCSCSQISAAVLSCNSR